ncbi:MAG: peptidoglycan DD-metalloendopeptidase family protein [Lactobacillales bacterium]|nr:peptidoglycan DD-metalloendopeptidase family protein [Lactobacillales bacterium]
MHKSIKILSIILSLFIFTTLALDIDSEHTFNSVIAADSLDALEEQLRQLEGERNNANEVIANREEVIRGLREELQNLEATMQRNGADCEDVNENIERNRQKQIDFAKKCGCCMKDIELLRCAENPLTFVLQEQAGATSKLIMGLSRKLSELTKNLEQVNAEQKNLEILKSELESGNATYGSHLDELTRQISADEAECNEWRQKSLYITQQMRQLEYEIGKVRRASGVYGYTHSPTPRLHTLTSLWGDGRGHKGWDISGPGAFGSPVVAMADGTVIRTGRDRGYGNFIEIDHGYGFTAFCAHLNTINVHPGQRVSAGQQLGTVGNTGNSTGPHLHFECRLNGRAYDPAREPRLRGRI